jgi:hypothetical protein
MLLLWALRLLIPHYDELVVNPATGKASQKNLFGLVGFVVGIGGAITAIVADLVEQREVDNTTILLLLGNGLGLTAAKLVQQQLNRKTRDEDGALVQPAPPAPIAPPKLMPQEETLADGNDGPLGLTSVRPAPTE